MLYINKILFLKIFLKHTKIKTHSVIKICQENIERRNFIMNEVLEYLKSCKIFYLATCENNQPHVRPFGAVCEYDNKLYIVTNNQKKVYEQICKNPKVEISGMHNDGTWIRVEGEIAEDSRREARVAMMNENEGALSSMYTVDDNLMTVFYFTSATAAIYSFTAEPKVIKF